MKYRRCILVFLSNVLNFVELEIARYLPVASVDVPGPVVNGVADVVLTGVPTKGKIQSITILI